MSLDKIEEGEKLYICSMTEEIFALLPSDYRALFKGVKVVYNDYHLYKDNDVFKDLYKKKQTANTFKL